MKPNNPIISVIIPVLNEEAFIGPLLDYLQKDVGCRDIREILVVDGGSNDATAALAKAHGARVIQSERGRAAQLNMGARMAKGNILYFLHADTVPPLRFDRAIQEAVANGYEAGCFQMRFDSKSPFLSFFAWCSRFNSTMCRGGDQSLFITKELFRSSGGYDESYKIYEDNEFTSRLYKCTNFVVLPQRVTTSARKYRQRNMLRLQLHFAVIHFKNYRGADPDSLYQYYRKNIA